MLDISIVHPIATGNCMISALFHDHPHLLFRHVSVQMLTPPATLTNPNKNSKS